MASKQPLYQMSASASIWCWGTRYMWIAQWLSSLKKTVQDSGEHLQFWQVKEINFKINHKEWEFSLEFTCFRQFWKHICIEVRPLSWFSSFNVHLENYSLPNIKIIFHKCALAIIISYYMNTNEIPGELSRKNLISSYVKITC